MRHALPVYERRGVFLTPATIILELDESLSHSLAAHSLAAHSLEEKPRYMSPS